MVDGFIFYPGLLIYTHIKNPHQFKLFCHLLGISKAVLKYEVYFLRQELVCPRLASNLLCDKDDLEYFILLCWDGRMHHFASFLQYRGQTQGFLRSGLY